MEIKIKWMMRKDTSHDIRKHILRQYNVLIVFNSVSGNNQIGFDLPVDNLNTGKVRNTFPTTYGELDIFQVS